MWWAAPPRPRVATPERTALLMHAHPAHGLTTARQREGADALLPSRLACLRGRSDERARRAAPHPPAPGCLSLWGAQPPTPPRCNPVVSLRRRCFSASRLTRTPRSAAIRCTQSACEVPVRPVSRGNARLWLRSVESARQPLGRAAPLLRVLVRPTRGPRTAFSCRGRSPPRPGAAAFHPIAPLMPCAIRRTDGSDSDPTGAWGRSPHSKKHSGWVGGEPVSQRALIRRSGELRRGCVRAWGSTPGNRSAHRALHARSSGAELRVRLQSGGGRGGAAPTARNSPGGWVGSGA